MPAVAPYAGLMGVTSEMNATSSVDRARKVSAIWLQSLEVNSNKSKHLPSKRKRGVVGLHLAAKGKD